MKEDKFPSKSKFKCPNCQFQFIPETINVENVIDLETHPSRRWIVEEDGRTLIKGPVHIFHNINELDIKPNNIIISNWYISCPECNYISKFKAQEAVKECSDDDTGISEFNRKFKYFILSHPKPYKDQTEFFIDFVSTIKEKINNALQDVILEDWIPIFNEEDSFKLAIRFISSLENYYKIKINDINKNEMPEKIKSLNLPYELQESLIVLNQLRNRVVHNGYELNLDETSKFTKTFSYFIEHIIIENLKPLNLGEIQIPEGLNFINIDYVKREIRLYLSRYFSQYHLNQIRSNFENDILNALNIQKI